MAYEQKPVFAIIGAGRVGTSLTKALNAAGYEVRAICSSREETIEKAFSVIGSGPKYTTDVADAARLADFIFITTRDAIIREVCNMLVSEQALSGKQIIAHTSGSFGLKPLSSAESIGCGTLAMHPLQTFPEIGASAEHLHGVYFGITASSETVTNTAFRIVKAMKGIPVEVAEDKRVLYHLGAVTACNLLVGLIHIASEIYSGIGFEDKSVDALLPLIKTTVSNISRMGTKNALTGPLSRGDSDTIKAHMDALLRERALAGVYRELSMVLLEMAKENIKDEDYASIKKLLRETVRQRDAAIEV